jgi:signal transduction histidine kinase
MVIWSGLATVGYDRARLRAWPMLMADLGVSAACVLATYYVVGRDVIAQGVPTLTISWMACPPLAVALVKGARWGVIAAVAIGGCDLAVRGVITQATANGTILMVMAAAALAYLGNIGVQAQEQLRRAAATEAAHAERDRLARRIHDSVLQVLALVQRQGEEIGGRAAELGRLAGEQELALRALVGPVSPVDVPVGMLDLRQLVGPLVSPRVTIAAPATAMWLPAATAQELFAAIAAATENARRHCPADARVWILLEDERGVITATVRDNGPGIAPGRLEQAAQEGRLGVAQAIRGRISDLGGQVAITTGPGQGTEIEMSVRR